jgi:GT2 family glycosyltransferase
MQANMSVGDPVVSVVIPALDPGSSLRGCVESFEGTTSPLETIVVDNGSSDDGVAMAVAHDAGIRVVRHETNVGFAAGCNAGAAIATGRYILFLNSDVQLSAQSLDDLVRVAESDGTAALWQPVVLEPDGGVENAGESFTWSGFFIRHTERRGDSPYPVFAGTAACLLARRDVFETVGGFRPGYFAYIEDIDLCWRTRMAGWEVRVVPSASAVHEKSVTTRRIFTAQHIRYLTLRNRFRMVLANLSILDLMRLVPLYVAACLLSVLALLLSGRLRSAYASLRAVLWPLAQRKIVRAERRSAQAIRVRSDAEVLRDDLVARVLSRQGWRMFVGHYNRWRDLSPAASGSNDH